MPADHPNEGPQNAFLGFQNYADDTPREADGRPHRPLEPRSWDNTEGWGEPLTFRPAEAAETDLPYGEAWPARRANVWPKLAVGAAVMAAFGGGFLLAHTDRSPATTAKRPVSEAAAMAAAQPMNVEVAKPTPIPIPPVSSTAKLEVLPRAMGPVASLAPRIQAPPIREEPLLRIAPAPTLIPRAAPQTETVAAAPPREVAEAAPPRDAAAVVPPPPTRTSFDCRDAPTAARAMVCQDAGLAAMDRRMKRAYAAAVASGAPEDDLAAEQRDWLAIREEAARYSRRSVVNIYRQRIDELEAMSERSW